MRYLFHSCTLATLVEKDVFHITFPRNARAAFGNPRCHSLKKKRLKLSAFAVCKLPENVILVSQFREKEVEKGRHGSEPEAGKLR